MPKKNPFHFKKLSTVEKLKCRVKYFNSFKSNKHLPKLDDKQAQLLDTLNKDGCIILNKYIDADTLSKMQQELQDNLDTLNFDTPCLAQTKIDNEKHKSLIDNYMLGTKKQLAELGVTFDRSETENYQQVIDDFNPSTLTVHMLKHSQTYRDVWTDPYLLGIISSYLGLVPQLAEAYVRRNFPAPHKTMNHFWHRDLNNKDSLLKMFVFLSDCTLTTGPHEFIFGSHKDFSKLNNERYHTDDEVSLAYPSDEDKCVSVVKAGTVVIEDTRGLHRARLPDEGHRDLGFAVFMPLRPFYSYKNYSFPLEAHSKLTSFQKAFIPKSCID